MHEPNHEDPLNQEAADLLRDNPKLFGLNVRKSIEGNIWVGGAHFPGCKTGFCFFVVQPWLYEVEGLYVFWVFSAFQEPNIDLEAGAVAEPKSNSSQYASMSFNASL
ncbi:hypothetical protein DVH24_031498 [Malus domestica]|uniref:Uncharacterized protein n=1 Tax=Malus domestica TaxID=3750 RepID=A0A498HI27_MALDO|nr:hypothetical protein DVH24_031498 [Malus domestica]